MGKEGISKELARIHAHLCGDGSVCIWPTKQKGRRFSAVIGYYNKNQKLLDSFRKDFSSLFNVKMRMRPNRDVYIRSIKRVKYFQNTFGNFGSKQWRIHSSIKNASEEIKLEWLKAFFEDEAYNEARYNRLKIKSVNHQGLKDVKELLDSLMIKSNITGPNCDNSYYITIPTFDSVEQFKGFVKEPIRK